MSQPFPPVSGPAPMGFDPFSPGFTVAAETPTPSNGSGNYPPPEAPSPVRRGPWGAWLRMTSPHHTPEELRSAIVREQMRRGQVLSGLLLIVFIFVALLFPTGFIPTPAPGLIGGLSFVLLMLCVCAVFNRRGNVTTASVLFVFCIALAIVANILTPPPSLGVGDLPSYDLFAIPVVLAGVLLPRSYSVITWAAVSLFSALDLILTPARPDLVLYLKTVSIYGVLARPIVLSGFLAVISWIAAGSVQRAIFQEDKNAEVERAYAALADQKRRLEEAIAVIQGVHARVANGDLAARAPIVGGELVPLTISLNLMLERLNRLQIAENTLGNLEMSVQHLSQVLAELAQGRIATPVPAAQN
ncbi:MAG: methyl-accepting chemotaxis protein, partial [Ktedonobacterales bacterium]|nr:methyl-accepting chemotaxis protein [Ktedonobacterales bacterium]